MRVAVYFSPWDRVVKPTGVGRFAVEMTSGLAAHRSIDALLLATRREIKLGHDEFPDSIQRIPISYLPGLARRMFQDLPYPPIDRWAKSAEWIYCPREQPVTTRRLRLAVNVNDMLAFEREIPSLTNRHGLRSRLRWAMTMRRVCKADLVTTISEFTRQRLLELFAIDPDRVVVTGCTVTESFFRTPFAADATVLRRYGVSPQEYFISVGSLTRRKGGDLLLQAATRLKHFGIEHPILVTGRRHDADLLQEFNREREISPGLPLKLLGYVPDEDQAILMSNALAFVFPSRYEGFGIPAVEAMAAGAPVIYSRTASLPEVMGSAGIAVEPNSVDELVDHMCNLNNNPQARESLIEQGRIRAREFCWGGCVDRLVRAMEERS